jgi:hypothetical protein
MHQVADVIEEQWKHYPVEEFGAGIVVVGALIKYL